MTSNGINALKVIDSLNLTIGDKCSRKWHGMKVKINLLYGFMCLWLEFNFKFTRMPNWGFDTVTAPVV